MTKKKTGISRRDFLKTSAALGAGAMLGPAIARDAFAASRARITIYHSRVADSLHPSRHSSSPIYGNWQHIMEPLVEYDYPGGLLGPAGKPLHSEQGGGG